MGGNSHRTEKSNNQFLNNSILRNSHVKRAIKTGEKGQEYTTLYWKSRASPAPSREKKIITVLREEMNAALPQQGKSMLFCINGMPFCVKKRLH